ncbi:MAG: hypothetical protein WHU54_09490 [Candidatus Bathyarchaeia archaeon]
MAQETTLVLKIDLRSDSVESGLKRAEQQAKATGEQVSKSFDAGNKSIQSVTVTAKQAASAFDAVGNIARNLVAIAGTVTAALGAVAGVVKLIKIDEQNAQALRSFEAAAAGAGINSEKLASQLNTARRGFVDFEDVLAASTKLLAEVGDEVGDKLPRLLELATKASVKFGVDTIDAYERLTQAVVTGGTKQLRAFGIYVDAGKAAKDYAASLGLTVDQLTEVERRQAILNAVLVAGERSFQGVDLSQKTVTQGLIELKNTLSELVEAIAGLFNRTLGPAIQQSIGQLNQFAKNVTEALTPPSDEADRLRDELSSINESIFELQKRIAQGPSIADRLFEGFNKLAGNSPVTKSIDEQLQALQASKQRILAELDRLAEESKAKQVTAAQETGRKVTEAELQAQAIILQNRSAFQKKLDELSLSARQAQIQALLVTANDEERLRLQTELLELEHQRRLESIRQEFGNKRGIGEAQVNALVEQERARHLAQVEALNAQFYTSQAKQKQNFESFLLQSTQATNQALVSIVSLTVQTLAASLIQGGQAFGNFGATILNIIGDLLINIGQAALAFGAVIDGIKASLVTLFGGNAIVAGLAAIALGGLLKAVASSMLGSGFKAGPAPSFGGGVTQVGGEPAVQPIVTEQELENRQAQREQVSPSITINVEGSLFNTEETGRTLVDLLSREFNKRGARIVKRSFA